MSESGSARLDSPGRRNRYLDVVVGDVMGKGVPAALLGAATKSHLMRATSELLIRTIHFEARTGRCM